MNRSIIPAISLSREALSGTDIANRRRALATQRWADRGRVTF
jgi:hypothetical protein